MRPGCNVLEAEQSFINGRWAAPAACGDCRFAGHAWQAAMPRWQEISNRARRPRSDGHPASPLKRRWGCPIGSVRKQCPQKLGFKVAAPGIHHSRLRRRRCLLAGLPQVAYLTSGNVRRSDWEIPRRASRSCRKVWPLIAMPACPCSGPTSSRSQPMRSSGAAGLTNRLKASRRDSPSPIGLAIGLPSPSSTASGANWFSRHRPMMTHESEPGTTCRGSLRSRLPGEPSCLPRELRSRSSACGVDGKNRHRRFCRPPDKARLHAARRQGQLTGPQAPRRALAKRRQG